MEQTETTEINEPKLRLNIKRNFKGEKGYEYTVRGDSIEEIKESLGKLKELAEKEVT